MRYWLVNHSTVRLRTRTRSAHTTRLRLVQIPQMGGGGCRQNIMVPEHGLIIRLFRTRDL